ncbi:helix-turn-helix transcriptional regulator [Streptomyces sp. WAC06614]|uniref:helix-turn-helix domain-containing protein n=1 Tax=Streptomyces sp. WAC06614 TaxID=2487416 RepID=UPI00163C9D0D|nr:helix-turn-helix transcriptional regulator [Streptomyces sp. WAC06614]
MTELARVPGVSAQVERGEIPEVVELGNVLKALFTKLELSQRQFAKRIGLDPSAVSRYFSGKKLPPKHFVKQLVEVVEDEHGAPVTVEVKETLHATWLVALKECDPAEHRLEVLRADLARSRRETERANRTVEALHRMLEEKEAQLQENADGLARLQLDWSAERTGVAAELEALRADLRDAQRHREAAEERSRELKERVLRLEEELAGRTAVGPLPLYALKGQLLAMWEDGDFSAAARDLTEAAWARPPEEVLDLADWLVAEGHEAQLAPFVMDVGRLRPDEEVVRIALDVFARKEWPLSVRHRLSDWFEAGLTPRMGDYGALARFVRGLGKGAGSRELSDRLVGATLRHATEPSAVVLLITQVPGTGRLPFTARALGRTRRRETRFVLEVAAGLFEAGLVQIADDVLTEALRYVSYRNGSVEAALRSLDGHVRVEVFTCVAQAGQGLRSRFAKLLYEGPDPALLDELVDRWTPEALDEVGLHYGTSAGLGRYLAARRR